MGGLIGNLSGALAGGGIGKLLSSGLGELVERFNENGHGDAADSWVKKGPNKELPPSQLKQAIGPDVLAALEQQTGLSQEELLARLSRELPAAVDQYTPDGQLPH
ncbi:YidB family protein [Bradyrhizobium elkanii]|uniref:YidB family protein n=1 Tax=Bradyrhizobium elkanii TaxID=29448 RepID=UPI003D25B250